MIGADQRVDSQIRELREGILGISIHGFEEARFGAAATSSGNFFFPPFFSKSAYRKEETEMRGKRGRGEVTGRTGEPVDGSSVDFASV